MEKRYLILSDIHGNVSAFDAVLSECMNEDIDGVILLGDNIDYGMRSNEIISRLNELRNTVWKDKTIVEIWGNHEKLVIDNDFERLSTDRGRIIAKYTINHLSEKSIKYVQEHMNKEGFQEVAIDGLKCLTVHGSQEDPYWKAIVPESLNGDYSKYDIVFSGHSHYPHFFTYFYPISNRRLRNKKAVLFINPGSIGQPRNQNPYAQYAVLELPSKRVELRAVKYDVKAEQALFPDEIDEFYKNRLALGV